MTGQMSSFQILTCCRAPMGSKGSLTCRAYPDTGTGTSEDVFYLLAIRGPTCSEGKPGIDPDLPIKSPARYLYATAAGFILWISNFILWISNFILWNSKTKSNIWNSKIPFWNSNVYSSHFKHHSLKLKDYSC